jgi:putative hydrolase of the HAD superfamily
MFVFPGAHEAIDPPQRLGIYAIWIDVRGESLPAGSPIKPDRIIRSLAELLPPGPKAR